MATMVEKTGKTIEEAIQAAIEELGVAESELEIEVLETPSKKFFGLLGETPAKIRATIKVVEPPPVVEEPTRVEEPTQVEEKPKPELPEIEPVLEPSPVEEPAKPSERERLIEVAKNFLQEVFATMNLEVTIEVEELDGVQLNLSGKGLGVLIGRRGQALDALQYLLNLAVNRKSTDERIYFTIDVEDYRIRREEALIKIAKNATERAIKTRKDVKLEPMSRHERKIIHTVLQENERVETHSAGEEPYRYVIVTPKRNRR